MDTGILNEANPPDELLTILRRSYDKSRRRWVGNRLSAMREFRKDMPDETVTRAQLFEMSANKTISDEYCFLSIMAWGGIRMDHARTSWPNRKTFLPIIADLRAGGVSRRTAYNRFSELQLSGRVPGLGPAYFTKLICFLRPERDGYILDQWTGKSVRLLTGGNTPIIDGGYVSRRNTADHYEEYCVYVERLAEVLWLSAIETEEALFSLGGKNPAKWRAYVKLRWSSDGPHKKVLSKLTNNKGETRMAATTKISTLGKGKKAIEFQYSGSVAEGVKFKYNTQPQMITFSKEQFEKVRKTFAGKTVEGGFSVDKPNANGFGEWLNETYSNLTPGHGSRIAAILVHEKYCRHCHKGNAVWLTFPEKI